MSFTGLIRTYHDNGILKEEYYVINDKKEGIYKSYYENGQIWVICNYIDGKKNGEYKSYSEDGILLNHKKNDYFIY